MCSILGLLCTTAVSLCAATATADIIAFQLIDASDNTVIDPLENGDQLNTLSLPEVSVNAATAPLIVGSVVFTLKENGTVIHSQVENTLPYALFGDDDGSFNPWPGGLKTNAEYELSARSYSKPDGTGVPSNLVMVAFTTVSSCSSDEECLDGLYCNGIESCVAGVCVTTPAPCDLDELCNEDTESCSAPKPAAYYVDDNGPQQPGYDPGATPGTFNHPFGTPQEAANAVAPGDTVIIRGGTYVTGVSTSAVPVLLVQTDGTDLFPITFKASLGEQVVFDGESVTTALIQIEASHIRVEGFELTGAKRMGVLVQGNGTTNVTVRECYAHHNDYDGNWIGGAFRAAGPVSHILFEDCMAHDNSGGFQLREVPNQTSGSASVPPKAGNIGFVDDLPEAEWDTWPGWINIAPRNVTIRGCIAFDNRLIDEHSDGIALRYAIESTIENCISFRNSDDGIDLLGGTRRIARGNIAFDNDPENTPNGDGNGIKIGVRGGLDCLVYRNISFDNRRGGIDLADTERAIAVHNTCFNNDLWFGIWSEAARSNVGVTLINNLSRGHSKGDLGVNDGLQLNVVSSNMLSDNNNHSWAIDLDNTNWIGTNPLFISENSAINTDFPPNTTIAEKAQFIREQVLNKLGLQPDSVAIDSGVSVSDSVDIFRDEFFGPGPDVGAVESNHCEPVQFVFADMGSAFGVCGQDGITDNHDYWHAINCFADTDPFGDGTYPCEELPPAAVVVDAGGSFGDCCPDGICDGNDAFHALNAFEGKTPCVCAGACDEGNPAPDFASVTAHTWLSTTTSDQFIQPLQEVVVTVQLGMPIPDLRGYQLHAEALGGVRGQLELVDMAVYPTESYVFHNQPGAVKAFNVNSGQLFVGLPGTGVPTGVRTYLASFVFRASADAAGSFVVDIRDNASDPQDRTFLFNTSNREAIMIVYSQPAFITVH